MKAKEKSIELGGRTLTLSTGALAEQASGAVLATYGETVVLATVVAAPLKNDPGYFPLFVEYQERLYAGGRIKGSRWVKREGRPSDDEILSARLIDRSIRPLFPQGYKKEVQVIITVLSVDIENDPSLLSAIATSAAIAVSPIPWKGPVASLRVGMKDKAYFINPLDSEMEYSELDLIVSSTKDSVLMIEAAAKEVSEEEILGAVEFAQKESSKVIQLIEDFTKEAGVKKEDYKEVKVSSEVKNKVTKLIKDKLNDVVKGLAGQKGGWENYEEVRNALLAELSEEDSQEVIQAYEKIVKEKVREGVLSGKRPDGRKHDEIRELTSKVGILPRTHGSAIFQRGQTQVLTVTTLGAPSLEQLIETAEGEESKRYMHHYSMPPYASGETGKMFPSRREIGHGALAEKALIPAIPTEESFPYTIRVVTEVLSSNGSTSMASVCGSTLSLMDAGVPISSPVSGIAMGLVIENDKKYAILSDIMGLEDHMGDMDFKIAGTKKGVCAMQLDVKTLNLTPSILKEALKQAKEGRGHILKTMLKTLPDSREKVSAHAPKIKVVKISPEKIGEVIGPGGKMIKKIIAETGAQVDVEDDGSVNISGTSGEAVEAAVSRVEALTKDVVPGEIYEGEVKRIQPFGAFVEILPGKDGLVHVSDMSEDFVKDPNDVVSIGQKVTVRVKEIDDMRRINLSMILDPSKEKKPTPRRDSGRNFRREPKWGGQDRQRGGKRFGERGRSSGPHFPTSRLVDSNKKDFTR